MFTWKPLDVEAVATAAKETGAIVTAENHNVIGGLGSAVAGALVKTYPAPMEMIGVQDEFGEVGPVDYLAERYGLTAQNIAAAAKKVLARKK
jgi:transketolase